MKFKIYQEQYLDDLIRIFNSNCPKYFEQNDLKEFIDFLENVADQNYYIVLKNQQIIGCGGFYCNSEKKFIGIVWVMFKRLSVGILNFNSTGTAFFRFLLNHINEQCQHFDIVINTTQLMTNTLSKFGFITEKTYPNGFGENLDHVVMRRKNNHQ